MSPIFIYLIQVNIALVLFYLLYVIVLRRDTFLRLRRFYFLSVIIFSLLYPFFAIPSLSNLWPSHPSDFQEVATTVVVSETGMGMAMQEETMATTTISWNEIFSWVYMGITFLFVLRFLSQLLSIYRIRTKSEKQVVSGITVYQLKDDITPFSFFRLIFIHSEKHSEAELSQILLHEHTHVCQWHSIDIIIVEWVCLFSWWNPFVWLMKREMAMNLEYLADSGVLREGVDSREYQYHLLRLTYHETAVQIVNNFNVSQLKQRIMMMNKKKSPTLKLAKYLLIVPLFFLFVTANSMYAVQNSPEPTPQKTYQKVDDRPEFPGGINALVQFLNDNIRYPKEAHEKKIEGRVICQFVVMNDGSIDSVKVVRGIEASLDEEAIRVIGLMPKWKPGMLEGEAVTVRFTLPIIFSLKSSEPTEEQKEVFQTKVENMEKAEFPGGEDAYHKFLADNIRYPVIAQENGIQGHVSVVFNVDQKGKVTFVRFEKNVYPSLDAEAKRVIESMPDWTPAKIDGEVTSMTTGADFVFRLQGETYTDPIPENAIVIVGYGKKIVQNK